MNKIMIDITFELIWNELFLKILILKTEFDSKYFILKKFFLYYKERLSKSYHINWNNWRTS